MIKKILFAALLAISAACVSSARTIIDDNSCPSEFVNPNVPGDAITRAVTLKSIFGNYNLYIWVTEYTGFTIVEFEPGMGSYIHSIEFKKKKSTEDYLYFPDATSGTVSLPFTTSHGEWEIRIVTTGGTTYKGTTRFFGPILAAPWPLNDQTLVVYTADFSGSPLTGTFTMGFDTRHPFPEPILERF